MNKQQIIEKLKNSNLDKDKIIVLSGASLVVQDFIESTNDIDLATTKKYYDSLNWQTKNGFFDVEIKFFDIFEISNNLFYPNEVVEIEGFKFASLEMVLKVKLATNREKEQNIIKKLFLATKKNEILLKFLGIGSMNNTRVNNTSAYFLFDKNIFFIDCGMTTFKSIKEKNLLNDKDDIFVALTHFHPDHIGSLPALILYVKFVLKKTINIVIPKNDLKFQIDIENFLLIQGALNNYYKFIFEDEFNSLFNNKNNKFFIQNNSEQNALCNISNQTKQNEKSELKTINLQTKQNQNIFNNDNSKLKSITFHKIKHCKELSSFAILINFNNFTYYYLGDNTDSEFLKNIISNIKKDDLIFTDCNIYNSDCHQSIENLTNIVPEKIKNQVFCMHFDDLKTITIALNNGFYCAFENNS